MRALLAQLCPRPGDVTANVARAVDIVVSHPEAELALFPEMFASGYRVDDLEPVAIRPNDGALTPLAEAAGRAGTAVALGFVERDGEGYFNALACFDAGGARAAVYRKTHLFGAENDCFTAGDTLVVVRLAGRRVAPLICFDAEFPEPARAAATAGADLLITVAANMEPEGREQEIATLARALENRTPHLYVNRCGAEGGLEFAGGTRAISAGGAVTAEAAGRGEEIVIAEVGPAGCTDERLDYLALSRGQLPVDVTVGSEER